MNNRLSHLPLARKVSKRRRNAEEECIKVYKLLRSKGGVCCLDGPRDSRYGVNSTFDNRAWWEARREKVALVDGCIAASLHYPLFDSISNYNIGQRLSVRGIGEM